MSRLLKIFERELNLIKDHAFKDDVIEIIKQSPDYIADIPSASTGKYHPRDEICKNGMIFHIKRCVIMSQNIANIRQHSDDELDILIASSLLHDIIKNGDPKGKYTANNHEVLAYNKIHEYYKGYVLASQDDPDYTFDNIVDDKLFLTSVCVLLHSGQWVPQESKDIYNELNRYVNFSVDHRKLFHSFHLVDCIVSRRTVADMYLPEWTERIIAEVDNDTNV